MSSASQSEEHSFVSHQRKSTTGGGVSTVGGVVPRKHAAMEEHKRNNHWEANRQPEADASDLVSITVQLQLLIKAENL